MDYEMVKKQSVAREEAEKRVKELLIPMDEQYNRIVRNHKMFFNNVLDDIKKRKWTDFDFHKDKMRKNLFRIRKVSWITVDENRYNQLYFPPPSVNKRIGLTMSRYSHYTLDKCHPSSKECSECFKYHCYSCGEGTNSMYGGHCSSRRCSNTIRRISKLQTDIIKPKRVYVFDHLNKEYYANLLL